MSRMNLAVAALLVLGTWACNFSTVGLPEETATTPATNTPAASATPRPSATSTSLPAPDFILHGGSVITMDPAWGTVGAVAIHGDSIQAVGSAEVILESAGAATQVIDLAGRTVLPGFIDSHSHWLGDRSMAGIESPDAVIQMAIEMGYTSINEMFVNQDRLNELMALDQEDRLRLRVNAYLPINYQDQRFGDWYLEHEPASRPSSNVRIAGIKIFMDHGWGGVPDYNWEIDELTAEIERAHDAGYQIAVHTVEGQAHRMVLDAFEQALGDESNLQYRHRIEHVIVLPDEQLARMAEMDIIASIQLHGPATWRADPTFAAEVTPELYPLYTRWQDLVQAGILTVGSSDWPWLLEGGGGEHRAGAPLLLLYQAVTRRGNNLATPDPWMQSQALTLEQALPMLNRDGAYATFEEDWKGTLAPRTWADLIVLNGDPRSVTTEELLDINILLTMIGGEVEYCHDPQADLCRELSAPGE